MPDEAVEALGPCRDAGGYQVHPVHSNTGASAIKASALTSHARHAQHRVNNSLREPQQQGQTNIRASKLMRTNYLRQGTLRGLT